MWRVEFESAAFLPTLPEECQGNPGVYGFELALWLAQTLAKQGVVTGYPLGEDWGWLIEHTTPNEVELTIGCSSMAEDGEGYLGKPIRWSVFVRPHISVAQRLKGMTHRDETQRLGLSIQAALLSHGIEVIPTVS